MRELDRNGDGRASLSEWQAPSLAWFDAADANHDGTVTPAERKASYATAAERRFDAHDQNHDGVLSQAELPELSLRNYFWLDTNGNGKVERREVVARWSWQARRDPRAHADETRASLLAERAREHARLDTSRDGSVDARELTAARRASCAAP